MSNLLGLPIGFAFCQSIGARFRALRLAFQKQRNRLVPRHAQPHRLKKCIQLWERISCFDGGSIVAKAGRSCGSSSRALRSAGAVRCRHGIVTSAGVWDDPG
jgi:hypothetical protein